MKLHILSGGQGWHVDHDDSRVYGYRLADGSGEWCSLYERNGGVYVTTSPFGTYSPYYAIVGDTVYVADNVAALVRQTGKREINERSLLEYMSFGCGTTATTLGTTTHIRGINTFPPGARSVVHETGLEVHSAWAPHGRLATQQEFHDRFRQVVADAVGEKGDIILPLTGGLDTRSILAMLVELGVLDRVRCFTFSGCVEDDQIAASICKHYHLPHKLYTNSRLADIDALDGLVPGVPYDSLTSSIRQEERGILLLGLCGNEVWRARLQTPCLLQRGTIAERVLDGLTTSINYPTLPDVYQCDVRSELLKAVEEQLSAWLGKTLTEAVDHVIWTSMVPNWAGTLIRSAGRYHTVYAPILDSKLAEMAYGATLADRIAGTFQRGLFAKHDYLASLRYDTDYKVNHQLARLIYYSGGRQGVAAARKVRRMLSFLTAPRGRGTLPSPSMTAATMEPLSPYEQLKRTMLDWDTMVSRDIFSRKKLERLVADNTRPPFVEKLVSLELWLRGVL